MTNCLIAPRGGTGQCAVARLLWAAAFAHLTAEAGTAQMELKRGRLGTAPTARRKPRCAGRRRSKEDIMDDQLALHQAFADAIAKSRNYPTTKEDVACAGRLINDLGLNKRRRLN
jgi:hypothetical protein